MQALKQPCTKARTRATNKQTGPLLRSPCSSESGEQQTTCQRAEFCSLAHTISAKLELDGRGNTFSDHSFSPVMKAEPKFFNNDNNSIFSNFTQTPDNAANFEGHLKGPCNLFDKRFHTFLRVWRHCASYGYQQHGAAMGDFSSQQNYPPSVSPLLRGFLSEVAIECVYCCNGKERTNSRYVAVTT